MEYDNEYSVEVPELFEGDKPLVITVDKIGGGTLGSSYTGTWTVAWFNSARMAVEEIITGTPKTHAEVAKIYADFLGVGLDTDEGWPTADRLMYWATGLDTDDNEE